MTGIKTPEFILSLLSILGCFVLYLLDRDVIGFTTAVGLIAGTFNISRGLVKKDTVTVLGPDSSK